MRLKVNAHDEDDHDGVSSPVERSRTHRSPRSVPSSPPPSFHSRASSIAPRNRTVNDPTLADAFDGDDSDSDEEPDDRQRLVRQDSGLSHQQPSSSSVSPQPTPTGGSSGGSTPGSRATPASTTANSNRIIFGSGIQSDGVFSNLTAKPERSGTEKEEQPPVCFYSSHYFAPFMSTLFIRMY